MPRNLFAIFFSIFGTFLEARYKFGHEPWQTNEFWFGHEVQKSAILYTASEGVFRGPGWQWRDSGGG
jgi:hypothetical protein